MRIEIEMSVSGQLVKQDIIEIPEQKLGELTDEEIENAIEINIRNWVDRFVQIKWEVMD